MKNYRLLCLLICTSILLSGCGLGKAVTSVALLPVRVATAVVDGATGRKMNLQGKLNSGVNEAFRPGEKMDKRSIERELSGKTLYTSNAIAYFNANGESIWKLDNKNKIYKDNWSAVNGVFCLSTKASNDTCYDIRKKDNTLLYGSFDERLKLKSGDAENLTNLYAEAKKQEAEKQAELARKQAEEKVAQERAAAEQKLAQAKAEAEQRLAQQKAEAEEKRCQASAKCRAEKERKERERAEDAARREAEKFREGNRVCVTTGFCGIIDSVSGDNLKVQITDIDCGWFGVCRKDECSGDIRVSIGKQNGGAGKGDYVWTHKSCVD